MTPGYERERVLDFTHPITEGCVFCHAGTVNLVPGTDNRFREPALTPISCERCHGPAEAHLKRPGPGSIVNPAKLEPRQRDSVCEQCHLEGEVRILNPGKHWLDFKPGADLESVFATYIHRVDPGAGVKAVSQGEELALSKCARESAGKLWCGTCHNPHSTAPNRVQEVRWVCLSCHAALFASNQHKPAAECVSCHMPRIRPNNVAHAAITDHRIGLPQVARANVPRAAVNGLSAWREPEPAVRERDFGLALFQAGSTSTDRQEIERSYNLLARVPVRDSEVLAALGSMLLAQQKAGLAVLLYRQATALDPSNARLAFCLGAALASDGKLGEAIVELRKSIHLDPSLPDAYLKLVAIYDQQGEFSLSQQVSREYLKVIPHNMLFRSHS